MGQFIDLTGRTFGKWRVILDTGERGTNGGVMWLCECECGMRKKVISASLLQGRSKGCPRCSRLTITNTYRRVSNGSVAVKCSDGATFLISSEDLPIVKNHQWWVDKHGYVKTKVTNRGVLLSRLLLGVDGQGRSVFVDHISGDTLDNRRLNLRVCIPEENIRNRKLNSNNKTGFKGVSYHRRLKKYRADIRAGGGRTIYLGVYKTPEEAAMAYDQAASFYHGEFARTNETMQNGGQGHANC